MSNYEQIEEPLNTFARVLKPTFSRKIVITTEIQDFSVRRKTVRVHPDQVKGADLITLLGHIIQVSEDYDNFRIARRKKAISEAKKIAAPQIEYLIRHDPEVSKWLMSFYVEALARALPSKALRKEETNGKMQTSDLSG